MRTRVLIFTILFWINSEPHGSPFVGAALSVVVQKAAICELHGDRFFIHCATHTVQPIGYAAQTLTGVAAIRSHAHIT